MYLLSLFESHIISDAVISTPKLPTSYVMSNMTGQALYQTFVNKQDPDREPEPVTEPAETVVSIYTDLTFICE